MYGGGGGGAGAGAAGGGAAMGGMMGGGAADDLQVRRADSERMEQMIGGPDPSAMYQQMRRQGHR